MKLLGAAAPAAVAPTVVPGGSASADELLTQDDANAQSVENDFAATGFAPGRQSPPAAVQDYQDAAGLDPAQYRAGGSKSAYAGPLAPAASSSSNLFLYIGGGAVIIAALYAIGRKK